MAYLDYTGLQTYDTNIKRHTDSKQINGKYKGTWTSGSLMNAFTKATISLKSGAPVYYFDGEPGQSATLTTTNKKHRELHKNNFFILQIDKYPDFNDYEGTDTPVVFVLYANTTAFSGSMNISYFNGFVIQNFPKTTHRDTANMSASVAYIVYIDNDGVGYVVSEFNRLTYQSTEGADANIELAGVWNTYHTCAQISPLKISVASDEGSTDIGSGVQYQCGVSVSSVYGDNADYHAEGAGGYSSYEDGSWTISSDGVSIANADSSSYPRVSLASINSEAETLIEGSYAADSLSIRDNNGAGLSYNRENGLTLSGSDASQSDPSIKCNFIDELGYTQTAKIGPHTLEIHSPGDLDYSANLDYHVTNDVPTLKVSSDENTATYGETIITHRKIYNYVRGTKYFELNGGAAMFATSMQTPTIMAKTSALGTNTNYSAGTTGYCLTSSGTYTYWSRPQVYAQASTTSTYYYPMMRSATATTSQHYYSTKIKMNPGAGSITATSGEFDNVSTTSMQSQGITTTDATVEGALTLKRDLVFGTDTSYGHSVIICQYYSGSTAGSGTLTTQYSYGTQSPSFSVYPPELSLEDITGIWKVWTGTVTSTGLFSPYKNMSLLVVGGEEFVLDSMNYAQDVTISGKAYTIYKQLGFGFSQNSNGSFNPGIKGNVYQNSNTSWRPCVRAFKVASLKFT